MHINTSRERGPYDKYETGVVESCLTVEAPRKGNRGANATPKAPRTGLRDQMENLLLGLPFEEANWPYEELGEELGSHQNRSTMLS